MQSLITCLLLLGIAFSCEASTFLYTWVPNPQPPLRPGFHRIVASGTFSVDSSVIASGVILNTQAKDLLFKVSSPANYFYRTFDRGSFQVDPLTGEIIGGGMHGTDSGSTYGKSMFFLPTMDFCENLSGGSFYGHWSVTVVN
jgi:hypothetical protein